MDAEYVDICHYGVLGMKWGDERTHSKAYLDMLIGYRR